MSDRNRRTERFHYGICLNDECSKCRNKEVQQIPLRKELVCEECGKPLRECAPISKKATSQYIILGLAIIVVGITVFFLLNNDKEKDIVQELQEETIVTNIHADSIRVEQKTNEGEETTHEDTIVSSKETTLTEAQSSPSYKLEFGAYEGPMNNRKPHGYGGTIKVTRSYSIDLKKMPAEHLQVEKGDVIVNTKFTDGILRAGELHRKDGTRKVFTI